MRRWRAPKPHVAAAAHPLYPHACTHARTAGRYHHSVFTRLTTCLHNPLAPRLHLLPSVPTQPTHPPTSQSWRPSQPASSSQQVAVPASSRPAVSPSYPPSSSSPPPARAPSDRLSLPHHLSVHPPTASPPPPPPPPPPATCHSPAPSSNPSNKPMDQTSRPCAKPWKTTRSSCRHSTPSSGASATNSATVSPTTHPLTHPEIIQSSVLHPPTHPPTLPSHTALHELHDGEIDVSGPLLTECFSKVRPTHPPTHLLLLLSPQPPTRQHPQHLIRKLENQSTHPPTRPPTYPRSIQSSK